MKPLSLALVVSASAAMLFGCQTAPKPAAEPQSMPMNADALASLRASFQQADPTARLGSVDDVLASGEYLTVGNVTVADFPVGSIVAIIDSNREVVANGEVVKTLENAVHVRYESKGARKPRVGDVAVRFGGAAAGA